MEPVAGSSNQNTAINYISSRQGRKILLYENRQYRKFKTYKTNTNVLWRCKVKSCSGFLTVGENEDVIKTTEHTCEPLNSAEVEIKKAINKLQQDAAATDTPVPALYKSTLNDLLDQGLNLAANCPNFKNVKTGLYKKRNRACGVDRLFAKSPKDVQVPKQYLDFLLADYNDGRSRILLFASKTGREELARARHLFCDGTFKSVPKPFRQIYSIHGEIDGVVKPLAYAMLLDKKKSTYIKLFELLKSSIPDMDVDYFTSDFEEAAVKGMLSVFPNAAVKGCYFHFKKALRMKAKELGLTENCIHRKHVALCTVLPHLPPDALDDAWLYVMSESPGDINVTQFNDYMISQWINHKFWKNKWCCYGQQNKTNNYTESHYSVINKAINKNGPKSLWTILKVLKETAKNYSEIREKMGKSNPQKFAEIRSRLINSTVEEFKNNDITIGHCMEKLRF